MKNVMMIAVVMACCAAFGIGVVGRSRGARLGEGKRLDATMVDRSKPKASTNAVVIADGVWKDKPGGLFGKKFGEAIPEKTALSGGKDERYVTLAMTAPKSKGQMLASYEVVIRAVDNHFFPSETAAPAEPSADLDSL